MSALPKTSPSSSAADQIRELLELFGWTQAKLAEELEVTQPTVSRWLSGKQDPNFQQTIKISKLAARDFQSNIDENITDTIIILGRVQENLEIISESIVRPVTAKFKYGMRGANFSGIVIDKNAFLPIGELGWILICTVHDKEEADPNSYYVAVVKDGPVLLRKVRSGSKDGRMHLIAPGVDPILDVEVALSMVIIGSIPPEAVHDVQEIDLS